MLLYPHPVNEEREARGALPVNSFWLSGCGRCAAAPTMPASRSSTTLRAPLLARRLGRVGRRPGARSTPARSPTCARRTERGEAVALTLCGERCAQRFEPRPRPLWQRLSAGWRAAPRARGAGGALMATTIGSTTLVAARRAAALRLGARAGRRAPAARAPVRRRAACARADELDDGLARLLPPDGAARRRGRGARCSPTRSRTASASASWPTTTATAPPPAPWRCAASHCSAQRLPRSATSCPTAPCTATA